MTLPWSPQICAQWCVLQNRYTSFCTRYIQRGNKKKTSESKQAFKTHFFLSDHSVKTGVHAADAELVWNVLKDYWHLPRKEYIMVNRTCYLIFIFKLLVYINKWHRKDEDLTKFQINLNLGETHSRLTRVIHNKIFPILFCLILGV